MEAMEGLWKQGLPTPTVRFPASARHVPSFQLNLLPPLHCLDIGMDAISSLIMAMRCAHLSLILRHDALLLNMLIENINLCRSKFSCWNTPFE